MAQEGDVLPNLKGIISKLQDMDTTQAAPTIQSPPPQAGAIPGVAPPVAPPIAPPFLLTGTEPQLAPLVPARNWPPILTLPNRSGNYGQCPVYITGTLHTARRQSGSTNTSAPRAPCHLAAERAPSTHFLYGYSRSPHPNDAGPKNFHPRRREDTSFLRDLRDGQIPASVDILSQWLEAQDVTALYTLELQE